MCGDIDSVGSRQGSFLAAQRIQRQKKKQTHLGTSPECTKRVCRQRTGGQLSETQSAAPSAASQETQLRQVCGVVCGWSPVQGNIQEAWLWSLDKHNSTRIQSDSWVGLPGFADFAAILVQGWYSTPPARYGTARLKNAVATSSLPCSSILAEGKNSISPS